MLGSITDSLLLRAEVALLLITAGLTIIWLSVVLLFSLFTGMLSILLGIVHYIADIKAKNSPKPS